jgi:hypothetical protein
MGGRVRAQIGSALPDGERQGAPGPGLATEEDSLSNAIRELVFGWGGQSEPRDDDERLDALRRAKVYA